MRAKDKEPEKHSGRTIRSVVTGTPMRTVNDSRTPARFVAWLHEKADQGLPQPLYRGLHALFQEAVHMGMLETGSRLPSSRALALELKLSRNTVAAVYRQLQLEGYLKPEFRRGTFVADTGTSLSHQSRHAPGIRTQRAGTVMATPKRAARPFTSRAPRYGADLFGTSDTSIRAVSLPDPSLFPIKTWKKLLNRAVAASRLAELHGSSDSASAAFGAALTRYLQTERNLDCQPAQVLTTGGFNQSVDFALRLLAKPGDTVWIEDPCPPELRELLRLYGVSYRAIPVDAEGMAPAHADLRHPPGLIIVSPSCHRPSGSGMTIARRRALLDIVECADGWMIECEREGEYRFEQRPFPLLFGLDRSKRVVTAGSFDTTLSPAAAIGYLLVPEELRLKFTALVRLFLPDATINQAVMAAFIDEGHYASHIRNTRKQYSRRRERMIDDLTKAGISIADSVPGAGLCLTVALPPACNDRAISLQMNQQSFESCPFSCYFDNPTAADRGLVVSFASWSDNASVTSIPSALSSIVRG